MNKRKAHGLRASTPSLVKSESISYIKGQAQGLKGIPSLMQHRATIAKLEKKKANPLDKIRAVQMWLV